MNRGKILFFILLLTVCFIPALAQLILPGQQGRALVLYQKDARRIYHKKVRVDRVPEEKDIAEIICLDKSNKLLYVATAEGVFEVTLDKEQFKQWKKDKGIPQLKNEELWNTLNRRIEAMDADIQAYNVQREEEIADSVRQEVIRLDSLRKVREKQIADSIARVRELEEREEYRRTHSPYIIPNPGKIRDIYNDNETIVGDTLVIASVTDGKVALKKYPDPNNLFKGVEFAEVANLDDCLKNSDFAYHYEVFADSLDNRIADVSKEAYINNITKLIGNMHTFLNKLHPDGYIDNFEWNDEYGTISFNLDYINTSDKTIKYMTVDVNFYNAVDDLRNHGTFNGTGPIEPFSKGGWEWDNTLIFTRGDESYCEIKRITITYTNGKKVVLTGNKIHYSNDYSD